MVKGDGTTVDSHAQALGLRDRKNPADFSSGRLTKGEIAVLSPRAAAAVSIVFLHFRDLHWKTARCCPLSLHFS